MSLRRELLHRRYWERIDERRRRLAAGVLYSYRVPPPPEFVDYWSGIPATLPEKLVFAELVRRGVSFFFSYFFGDMPFTGDREEKYRPDFLLPDYRIVIEIAGVYWHTRPGMYEHDETKAKLFEAAGYKFIVLTDEEVLDNVVEAIDKHLPELRAPIHRGGQVIIGERPLDPTAAVSARIKRFPKVVRLRYRKRSRGPAGVVTSRKPMGKAIRPAHLERDPLFTHRSFEADTLQDIRDFGTAWLDWIDQLGDYFNTNNSGENELRRKAYPELYDYWERWKDWWNRFQIS